MIDRPKNLFATCKSYRTVSTGPFAGTGRKQLRGKDMKPAITNVLKASFVMVAGWTFSAWLLFLFISSIAVITQA
jgi:hypothetical protein